MKKHNTVKQSPKRATAREAGPITIGMDLGDKTSCYCVLGGDGEVLSEGSVATTKKAMTQKFGGMGRCRIAMEVGTHSPWLSRLLSRLGFEVIVANPRQVRLISASSRKNDRMDAQLLARLARVDPKLLRPIRHRSEEAQADLLKIRVRASLLEARTGLINAARGFSKAQGDRLPACDADVMDVEKMEALPESLQETLRPLLEQVESLTEKIQRIDAASTGAGTWAAMWVCVRSRASRARASRNCGSARKATCICASCWCKGRTVSCGAVRIRI
jgi:transposase